MESITFRGAFVRHYDGRKGEGGAFVRIHMTADFSDTVVEALEWEDPGHSSTDTKLEGELMASNFILTPGDKMLAQYEIQFGIRSVGDFKMVRVVDGESKRRELRFTIGSNVAGVAAMVDDYIRRVGDHQGALKVSYSREEQQALPLRTASTAKEKEPEAPEPKAEAAPEADFCVSCENNLPLTAAGDYHTNGTPCKNSAKHGLGSSLASAVQVAGSTAELKKSRGRKKGGIEIVSEAGVEAEESDLTGVVN